MSVYICTCIYIYMYSVSNLVVTMSGACKTIGSPFLGVVVKKTIVRCRVSTGASCVWKPLYRPGICRLEVGGF